MDWLFYSNNFRFLAEGFLINVEIALIAMAFALAFALLLALLAISPITPIRFATKGWIDVFRNLPLILLILYIFLTLPEGVKEFWSDNAPGFLPEALRTPLVLAGIGGLVLYNSAVLAEIMRAGILSLDRGQREAAAALGMTYGQQMRLVVLPQGLRRMVPATVSQLITLMKDTTLVSIIGIQEAVRQGRILSNTSSNVFVNPDSPEAPFLQVIVVVGLMFVAFNFGLSRLSRRLEIRERARTAAPTGGVRVTGVEDQIALDRPI